MKTSRYVPRQLTTWIRSSVAIPTLAGVFIMLSHVVAATQGENASGITMVNIFHPIDIASDVAWDANHIDVVRIVDVQPDEATRPVVTLEFVQRISDGPPPGATRSIQLAHLHWPTIGDSTDLAGDGRFAFGRGGWPYVAPPVENDDLFVAFQSKEPPSRMMLVKLTTPVDESPLVRWLREIKRLRAGGLEALSEGVFSDEPAVALYCLQRMQTRWPGDVEDYVMRLQTLRDDDSKLPEIRLLARQLEDRLRGRSEKSAFEYRWLKETLLESPGEWPAPWRFAHRMVEFDSHRPETVEFFAKVVQDQNARQELRTAVRDQFSDERLLKPGDPDGYTEKIVDACVSLLADPDVEIRRSGAATLHAVVARTLLARRDAGGKAFDWAERTREAYAAAIRRETDDLNRMRMTEYMQEIEERLNPDYWK